MKKFTSSPFLRVAKGAASEAHAFLQDKDFEYGDAAVLQQLEERPSGYLYRLSEVLHSSANFHNRIAFSEVLGGAAHTVNLVDCWVAECLAAKFREQEWISGDGKSVPRHEIFDTFRVRLGLSKIHSLALASWKLYAAGHESYTEEMASLFELYDMRQDATSTGRTSEDLEAYDLSICVSLVVGRGNPDMERIVRLLSPIPVFERIEQFWKDDNAFARFTERAAQWHFDYSNKNMDKFRLFAETSADILTPSWVLALDTFRQKHFGRPSCLGTHELLHLSLDLIALAKTQRNPKHEVFAAAEKFYAEQFGDKPLNPVPFWEKVMGI